jgi:hypothetical protein
VTTRRRTTALIGDDNTVVVAGKRLTWRTLHKLPQLPSPAAVLVDNGPDALRRPPPPRGARHRASRRHRIPVDERMREELGESGFAIVLPDGDVRPAKLKAVEESGRAWLLTSVRPAVRSASATRSRA